MIDNLNCCCLWLLLLSLRLLRHRLLWGSKAWRGGLWILIRWNHIFLTGADWVVSDLVNVRLSLSSLPNVNLDFFYVAVGNIVVIHPQVFFTVRMFSLTASRLDLPPLDGDGKAVNWNATYWAGIIVSLQPWLRIVFATFDLVHQFVDAAEASCVWGLVMMFQCRYFWRVFWLAATLYRPHHGYFSCFNGSSLRATPNSHRFWIVRPIFFWICVF